jgi:hypothetical protein
LVAATLPGNDLAGASNKVHLQYTTTDPNRHKRAGVHPEGATG